VQACDYCLNQFNARSLQAQFLQVFELSNSVQQLSEERRTPKYGWV
jgi:hypothetical protein